MHRIKNGLVSTDVVDYHGYTVFPLHMADLPILVLSEKKELNFAHVPNNHNHVSFDLQPFSCERKMKVKVLCRNPQDYLRQRKSDIHKLPRNLDPALHPLEGPREYVRALNATKLERVFAKPFVGSLSGHTDGVYCLCKHRTQLSKLLSGELSVDQSDGSSCYANYVGPSVHVYRDCSAVPLELVDCL